MDTDQIAPQRDTAEYAEPFQPAPLSLLFAWLFRSTRTARQSETSEPFEDHINGLA